MRKSSIIILLGIFLVFVSIQGWVISRKLFTPATFVASEAVIMGRLAEVRVPFQGLITDVHVVEHQRVRVGDPLLTIAPSPLLLRMGLLADESPLQITAARSGIVDGLVVLEGAVVQADQLVTKIVDTSMEEVYVQAKINVLPADVPRIQPLLRGSVQAEFLNGGRVLPALVSSVDPMYDASRNMLEVRLRLLADVPELSSVGVGLPVQAWLQLENDGGDSAFRRMMSALLPTSEAQQ